MQRCLSPLCKLTHSPLVRKILFALTIYSTMTAYITYIVLCMCIHMMFVTFLLLQAIRMHKVNGRNFLHCLRLAKEGFPSASASVAVTSHLSPLPSQPPRALTSPTHRALATSVSVPVESQTTRSNMPLPPRSNMPLPPPPVDETRKNPNMLRPQYDRSTACPPVPSNGMLSNE